MATGSEATCEKCGITVGPVELTAAGEADFAVMVSTKMCAPCRNVPDPGPFEHLITVEYCLRSWQDEPDHFPEVVRMVLGKTADIIDEMRAHLRDFGRHSEGCCYTFGTGCKCGWHDVCVDLGFDDPVTPTEPTP